MTMEKTNENINVEVIEQPEKPVMRKYKGLKIAIAIVFALACLFYVINYIDLFNSSTSENFGITLGFFLAIVVILCAPMVFAPTIVLGIIGIILSSIGLKRKYSTTGSLIYFIVFTLLPFVLYFAMIFLTKLIV